MSNNIQNIDVTCYSDKTKVSIGFGFEPNGEYALDTHSSIGDLVNLGAADAFWENYNEFSPGIEKAKQLLNEGKFSSFREALVNVFGHFAFAFESNGKAIKLDSGIESDELMYSLLEQGA